MELKKIHLISALVAFALIAIGYFLASKKLFPLIAGIGALIGFAPFLITLMKEIKTASEKEEMFLEFARNLVESVKTGTPISKSIVNMSNKNYGALTEHIQKLANQISLGIPLNKALDVFSKDVKNKSISRSLTLIGQAERAGGEIGEILESVAGAVSISDKLKKERKASISTLVSQGYIIFLVFIVIILVMQYQIIPMVSGIANVQDLGLAGFGVSKVSNYQQVEQRQISNSFLYLILTQGFCAGLVIGKISEGSIKAGIKHSFSLMFLSFLISAIANALLSKGG
ncbi:MAG: type II secretion system F family protein [Candidatus Pacearchaeota archaeon]|jgi:flagellar protein FlaJ